MSTLVYYGQESENMMMSTLQIDKNSGRDEYCEDIAKVWNTEATTEHRCSISFGEGLIGEVEHFFEL